MFIGSDGAVMEEQDVALLEAADADPVDGVVLRILDGDLDAFEELIVMTEMKVLGVAWRMLGDREQARDAAQEVFLRVFRSLKTFRVGESFHAWMYRITINVCFDHLKKRGPIMMPAEVLENVAHEHYGVSTEDSVLREQHRALLQQALGKLTSAERSALVLRDLEGLSTEEVASVLGVRPVTVRSQVSSARSKVKAFCARVLRKNAGGVA